MILLNILRVTWFVTSVAVLFLKLWYG